MQQQIITFIINHWVLVALFLVLLVIIIWYEAKGSYGGIPQESPQTATLLVNRQDAVMIDVRDPAVFVEGHITDAINVPANALDENVKKIESYKTDVLILYCGQGLQSASVAKKLSQLGFQKLHILSGGLQAWQAASLPLVKKMR